MGISKSDEEILLAEFRARTEKGIFGLGVAKPLILTKIDDIINTLPSDIWEILERNTAATLLRWYSEKRKMKEI